MNKLEVSPIPGFLRNRSATTTFTESELHCLIMNTIHSSNALALNEEALDALGKGEFLRAQEIFRRNARLNPSLLTFNNLGVFYATEGIEQTNGKTRSAKKLGLKYLKKAESQSQSGLNVMAIGDWYYVSEDYESALDYYKRAYDLNASCANSNNLGAALYRLGRYDEAVSFFGRAVDKCGAESRSTVTLSYAFLLVYDGDKKRAHEVLTGLTSTPELIDPDVLALAFLCGDCLLAENIIQPLLDTFYVDSPVMAMIVDCLLSLGQESNAIEYLDRQIDLVQGFDYNTKPEISRLNKLLMFSDSNYRETVISEYRYVPQLIKQCYYIGCKIHNP